MKFNISDIYEVSLLLGWIASLVMIVIGISMCICETVRAEDVLLSGCLIFILTFIGLACFYGGK